MGFLEISKPWKLPIASVEVGKMSSPKMRRRLAFLTVGSAQNVKAERSL